MGALGARWSESPFTGSARRRDGSAGSGRELAGAGRALLIGQPQALEDQPVQVEIERDVLALCDLAREEAKAPVAPQNDVVDDAPQHFVDRVAHLLAR